MTSIARRAGARLLQTIADALDPAAEIGRALLYSKPVGRTPQFFVRSPDFPRQISGNECNLWNKPLNPSAYDDEFESTVLDPSWTTLSPIVGSNWSQGNINPYASFSTGDLRYELHTQRRPSWLVVQPPDVGFDYTLEKTIAPTGDFFVWIRASLNFPADAAEQESAVITFGISASPWDSGNFVHVRLGAPAPSVNAARFYRMMSGSYTQIGTTANEFSAQNGLQPIEAIGITRRGSSWDAWAFGASGNSIWLGATTLSIVPGTIRIGFVTAEDTKPGNRIMGIDFFRYRDGSLWLP